jgi:hypothetical protein
MWRRAARSSQAGDDPAAGHPPAPRQLAWRVDVMKRNAMRSTAVDPAKMTLPR